MAAPKGHPPYNVNGEGGQPPKYNTAEIERFADLFEIWLQDENNYWFKDFFISHKVNCNYIAEWAKSNQRFRSVYLRAKEIQESRVFKGSMSKTYCNRMSTLC
jgi:hypothetical protein